MKPALKELWIKKLTDGSYRQGKEALCWTDRDGSNERFCCLGVLADIGLDDKDWVATPGGYGLEDGEAICTGSLPTRCREKLGISRDHHHKLADLNDRGMTFPALADWIRQNVPTS